MPDHRPFVYRTSSLYNRLGAVNEQLAGLLLDAASHDPAYAPLLLREARRLRTAAERVRGLTEDAWRAPVLRGWPE